MKHSKLFLKIKKNKIILLVIFCILYVLIFYYWITEIYPNSTNIFKKLPNFLTNEECDKIISISKDNLEEGNIQHQNYDGIIFI